MEYKRILLKISGGGLAGEAGFGFDQHAIGHIVDEIRKAVQMGIELAIMVGGGNIFRGILADDWGIERAEADNIGMTATVINSLLLRGALNSKEVGEVRVMTATPMNAIAEPYIRLKAIRHLSKGFIVIFAGGTGQPYVTTDYPAIQRALEVQADAVLLAKDGVDGVYDCNPRLCKNAKRYKTINFDEAISRNIKVIDQSGFLLARDYNLPLHIFDFDEADCIKAICEGRNIGTFVSKNTPTAFYEC